MERSADQDRSDTELQDAVEAALRTALPAHAPHIGVASDHGAITLTGELATWHERQTADAATLDVPGVHAVANGIVVPDPRSPDEIDTEIARLAEHALQQGDGVPRDTVIAEVLHRVVTLRGTVSSAGERFAAERAVIDLPGLSRINNRILVSHHRYKA